MNSAYQTFLFFSNVSISDAFDAKGRIKFIVSAFWSPNYWFTYPRALHVYSINLIYIEFWKFWESAWSSAFPQKKVLCSNSFRLQMAYLNQTSLLLIFIKLNHWEMNLKYALSGVSSIYRVSLRKMSLVLYKFYTMKIFSALSDVGFRSNCIIQTIWSWYVEWS